MITALLLASWMACGAIAAAALVDSGTSRWAWTPMAAVLGPLWIAVAVDQRATARAEEAHR